MRIYREVEVARWRENASLSMLSAAKRAVKLAGFAARAVALIRA